MPQATSTAAACKPPFLILLVAVPLMAQLLTFSFRLHKQGFVCSLLTVIKKSNSGGRMDGEAACVGNKTENWVFGACKSEKSTWIFSSHHQHQQEKSHLDRQPGFQVILAFVFLLQQLERFQVKSDHLLFSLLIPYWMSPLSGEPKGTRKRKPTPNNHPWSLFLLLL